MPTELLTGTPGSRRDRSLVVAYWVLGIVAVLELLYAAVGMAPKVASTVRKAQPTNQSADPQQVPLHSQAETAMNPSNSVATLNAPGQPPSTPSSPVKTVTEPTALTIPEPAEQQPVPPVPVPGSDSTDRPFRQPPSDAASPDGAAIEILNAEIKGNEGGSQTLQLAIKSRSHDPIDVPQVKVQVYFYDEQNGEIVPSKAQVTSRWLSAPVDWSNGKPELLEVRYLADTADPDVRFAGYVVAIYYKGDLQDCRANPPKLKKLFEPKYFIGLDEP
jgi:hypothetical protein